MFERKSRIAKIKTRTLSVQLFERVPAKNNNQPSEDASNADSINQLTTNAPLLIKENVQQVNETIITTVDQGSDMANTKLKIKEEIDKDNEQLALNISERTSEIKENIENHVSHHNSRAEIEKNLLEIEH